MAGAGFLAQDAALKADQEWQELGAAIEEMDGLLALEELRQEAPAIFLLQMSQQGGAEGGATSC